MAQDIRINLDAKDNTGAAFKSVQQNISKTTEHGLEMGEAFKVLIGFESLKRVKRFFEEAVKAAAEADPAIKKSFDHLQDQFENLQAGVGKAIIGNGEFTKLLSQMAEVVFPLIIDGVKIIVHLIDMSVDGWKMLWQVLKPIMVELYAAFQKMYAFLEKIPLIGAYYRTLHAGFNELKDGVVGFVKDAVGPATTAQDINRESAKRLREEHQKWLETLAKEVSVLSGLAALHALTGALVQQMKQREDELTAALKKKNLSLAEELDLRKELADLTKSDPFSDAKIKHDTDHLTKAGEASPVSMDFGRFHATAKALPQEKPLQDIPTQDTVDFQRGLNSGLDDMLKVYGTTKSLHEEMGDLASSTLPALADAFSGVFDALGKGSLSFGSFAKSAVKAISQVASKMAASEFAEGLAMLARSIWDGFGPNPVAAGSASQHFAAAALFAGIGGIGNAISGGSGGSGAGGGSAFSSSQLNDSRQQVNQGKGTLTINVPTRYLDSADYAFADMIMKIQQQGQFSNVVIRNG